MLKIKNVSKFFMTFLLGVPFLRADSGNAQACSLECSKPISKNTWQPHAFSGYALQDILILQGLDCDPADGNWVNKFGFATEYMQSFGNNCNGLGAMPFWSGTNTMTIGNNNGKADLDAFQFGLGEIAVDPETGIAGTITLNPKVQHTGTEFLWYITQNENKPGFYAKVKAPLGAMMVTSNVCETPVEPTDVYTDLGYPIIPFPYAYPPLRFKSVSQALYGGIFNQDPILNYGKIGCNKKTVVRFGDISAVAGANFVVRKSGHCGVGVKVSCPTGNVPQAVYMLEPIFGRAGHWGLGGEISAHYTHEIDNGSCFDGTWTVWVQAEALHLFSGRKPSWRSFDLKANGPGSKYLLVQRYYYNSFPTAPVQQAEFGYQPEGLHPAINLTTLPVVSTFGIEGNFALLFDYQRNNWNMSVGGEFWGRSKENLAIACCSPLQDRDQNAQDFNLNNYAVIGRQIAPINTNAAEYWCEPLARINKSQDPISTLVGTIPPSGIADPTVSANRIPADYNEALDIEGAAACRIFTGKVIGEVGYTWQETCHAPHLSVYAGAELADKDSHWVNLWSVGLQASLQF